jgi:hypothetical protein
MFGKARSIAPGARRFRHDRNARASIVRTGNEVRVA